MKKIIKRSFFVILAFVLGWVVHYAWVSFPIVSGFGAKQLCSAVFVSGRDKDDVLKNELADFPLSLGTYTVNMEDSSVTGTVFGMAKKKAIYRRGIGATVINNFTEKEVRAQSFNIPPPTTVNQDTIAWPMGNKFTDTFPAHINKEKLQAAIDKSFEEPYPDKKIRTRAVVVLYDGQMATEKYASGYDKDTKMYGWSMAKSVTSALIATLVKQGKLDVTKPAPVPEWSDANDPRHGITLENILHQQSGLNFVENYAGASDVTNMLYKEGNMAAFTARHPLEKTPGTEFSYTSGNSNIIARIIRQTVGEKGYAAYPATALFYKTGMYSALFEPDASGTYVGSSYIMATARDYARFGLLYYNDGICNGERILPEGWVKHTVAAPASNKLKGYGYQFWLNGISPTDSSKLLYMDVPADMFYCDGYGGQFIYIIPSKKLVVVRLGLTLDDSFNENGFLRNIIDAVEE